MFSLIITIISIALVAALALATLYYGGSAYKQGAAKADAAKILLQGQQLIGASELYLAGEGHWPLDLPTLKASKYLTSTPHASAMQAAVEQAQAAGVEWVMPKEGTPMFLLPAVSGKDVCRYVNVQGSLKNNGIPKLAYPGLTIQCFGNAAYQVVIKKAADTEISGGTPNVPVGLTPVPSTDPTSPDWSTPPGAPGGGSTGPVTGDETLGVVEYRIDGQVVTAPTISIKEGDNYAFVTVSIHNTTSNEITFLDNWSINYPFVIEQSYNACAGVTLTAAGGANASCDLDIDYHLIEGATPDFLLVPPTTSAGAINGLLVKGKVMLPTPGEFGIENAAGELMTETASDSGGQVPSVQFTWPSNVVGDAVDLPFKVVNYKNAPLSLAVVGTQGGMTAELADNCKTGFIPAGEKCAVRLKYTRKPVDASSGSLQGSVQLSINGGSYETNVSSRTYAYAMSPSWFGFSERAIGASMVGTSTIYNISRVPFTVRPTAHMSIGGAKSSINLTSNSCGSLLYPGDSCVVSFDAKKLAPATQWYEYYNSGVIDVNIDEEFASGNYPFYLDYLYAVWTTSAATRLDFTGSPDRPDYVSNQNTPPVLNFLSSPSAAAGEAKVLLTELSTSCNPNSLSVSGYNACVVQKLQEFNATECQVIANEPSWVTQGMNQTRITCPRP